MNIRTRESDGHLPQSFEIRTLGPALGAEVIGLDLRQALNEEDFLRLRLAHLAHHVLVFRDQQISPAQQIAFSRRFGPLQIHVLQDFQLPGHPEIMQISNIRENGKPIGLGDAGHFWHSDLSYVERPSLGSMLHAQELPTEGGDTLFANQQLAYDSLPEALKAQIAPLRAEHHYLARCSTSCLRFRLLPRWSTVTAGNRRTCCSGTTARSSTWPLVRPTI